VNIKNLRKEASQKPNEVIFFLDKKETKDQEKTILSPRLASPRPAFFRANALFTPC